MNMNSIDSDKIKSASELKNRTAQQLPESYQRHGRTTAIDDHSDLQVLKRIKR